MKNTYLYLFTFTIFLAFLLLLSMCKSNNSGIINFGSGDVTVNDKSITEQVDTRELARRVKRAMANGLDEYNAGEGGDIIMDGLFNKMVSVSSVLVNDSIKVIGPNEIQFDGKLKVRVKLWILEEHVSYLFKGVATPLNTIKELYLKEEKKPSAEWGRFPQNSIEESNSI